MTNTPTGQPYDMLGHDVQFWRKCLNEGLAAEFSPDQYRDLPTRQQQDAFCQEKLTEAINQRAAIAELIDLCERCEQGAKSNFNIPELLKAHETH